MKRKSNTYLLICESWLNHGMPFRLLLWKEYETYETIRRCLYLASIGFWYNQPILVAIRGNHTRPLLGGCGSLGGCEWVNHPILSWMDRARLWARQMPTICPWEAQNVSNPCQELLTPRTFLEDDSATWRFRRYGSTTQYVARQCSMPYDVHKRSHRDGDFVFKHRR